MDRTEAAEHLRHLTRDLKGLYDLLTTTAAAVTAQAVASPSSTQRATTLPSPPAASDSDDIMTSSATGAGGAGRSLAYSLVRAVVAAGRGVSDMRSTVEWIRCKAAEAAVERDRAAAGAVVAESNLKGVVRLVGETLALPEVFMVALLVGGGFR